MNEVQRIWIRARDLYGHTNDRRAPSPGISALLTAMLDGPTTGCDLARRAGLNQPNVTTHWLPKLKQMRLVDGWEIDYAGRGGRRAHMWALTGAGRTLAEALQGEQAA